VVEGAMQCLFKMKTIRVRVYQNKANAP